MSDTKPKPLTAKQERFCREYVVCMNASEAYRRAYSTENMKEATVNNNAYKLLQNNDISTRINELKQDIEESLGISKITMIQTLQKVIDRSLQAEPVMKFDKIQKEEVQVIDPETGEGVFQYDSAGVNSAVDKIMKAMGYYAPNSIVTQDKEGNIMPLSSINITIKDNTDES
jgi:phage terminase small subunit